MWSSFTPFCPVTFRKKDNIVYRKSLLSRSIQLSLVTASISLLSACGGGSDSPTPEPPPPPPPPPPVEKIDLSGGGVKGPMAFAAVKVYQIDTTQEGFKGAEVGTASTNAQAQIENLSLELPLSPPYLLEITAIDGTIDITTSKFPVITKMKTVVTQEMLDAEAALYATPLSGLAVDLAFANADSSTLPYTGNADGTVSAEELLASLNSAQQQVKSTLGFGIGDDVDIFSTPPLIDASTTTPEQQAATAAYRSAVEAVTAVVYQMQQLAGETETDTNDILQDLAADLSDGTIDGMSGEDATASYPAEALDILQQDPASLPIPNDDANRTVGDVKALVVSETAQTGNSETDTDTYADSDDEVELAPAETSPDIDGDGVLNTDDDYPEEAGADTDTDGDGLADVFYVVEEGVRTANIDSERSDSDDDNDGVADDNDAFSLDATEHTDTDGDGIGNNADTDDDGDGVDDNQDDFPLDSTRSNKVDEDGDGWPVGQDTDDSNADLPEEAFVDTDGDGFANTGGLAPDTDDDNDGVPDTDDAFPLDAAESGDLDGDQIGDNTDTDIDGDDVPNDQDVFPRDGNESVDTDGDGIGNNADMDDDGDGLTDAEEAELGTDPLLMDTDGDGVFDGTDALPLDPSETFDSDSDGIGNNTDNCPLVPNFHQVNSDDDAFGDVCDLDDDNDGVPDTEDAYPLDPTRSESNDADGDGWPADQDPDDNDANNPGTPFVDTDGDGIGDGTDEDDDNDGVLDVDDAFPLDDTEWSDYDGDGQGDNGDTDDDNDGLDDDVDLDPRNASVRRGGLADEFVNNKVSYLEGDYDHHDGTIGYSYESIYYDEVADTTTFSKFFYDMKSMMFVESERQAEAFSKILTEDGWLASPNDYRLIEMQSADKVLFKNSIGQGIFVSANSIDKGEISIAKLVEKYDHRNAKLWAPNLDASASFTAEAQLYKVDFIRENAAYEVWDEDHCNEDELIGGSCNFVDLIGYENSHPRNVLSHLNELFSEQPWHEGAPEQLKAYFVGGHYDAQELFAEFITSDETSGEVNYFVVDNQKEGVARRLAFTGTWHRKEVHGVELIKFEVPKAVSELLNFDLDADEHKRLFSVVDGFVRVGSYYSAGEAENSESNLWINEVALEEITQAFSIVDTDGDGKPDVMDNDDDNDGIPDEEDAFPTDPNEWLDTDGDGTGNNADTDDDNDGVLDADDAAPLDDSVGAALELTNDSLVNKYIQIFKDSPIEPKIQLGYLSGKTFEFADNNQGTEVDTRGTRAFSWAIASDVMTLTPTEANSSVAYMSLEQLVADGVITKDAMYAFKNAFGDYTIEVNRYQTRTELQLVASTDNLDTFWQKTFIELQIANAEYRIVLFGSEDAPNVAGEVEEHKLELTPFAQMANSGFPADSIVGTWAMPFNVNSYGEMKAGLLEFSANETGLDTSSNTEFTWQLDSDGLLQITFAENQSTSYQLVENFDIGVAVYAVHDTGEQKHAGYSFANKIEQESLAFNLQGKFLMSSFTLTNSDYLDEDGKVKVEEYFGFQLNDDQMAKRIFGSSIIEGRALESWYWEQGEDDLITLSARRSYNAPYDVCEIGVDGCDIIRRRMWQPLAQEGERLYVLEWSQWNDGYYDSSTDEPIWREFIPARVHFYEAYPASDDAELVDTDGDGIVDSEDAFPFNPYEWLDSDGDGIGNNADTDDDNDGIVDWEDAFPRDANEWLDTDGDGIGNNADTDDDGDGVADEDDLAPLNDSIGAALAIGSDTLSDDYIRISEGRLENPNFSIGVSSGTRHTFSSDGTAIVANNFGGAMVDWVIESDAVELTYNEPQKSTSWVKVSDMAEMGIISAAVAQQYIDQYSDEQISLELATESEQWQLVENTDSIDRFWVIDTVSYYVTEQWQREYFYGNADAAAVQIVADGYERKLTELDSLTAIAFTDELATGGWGLEIGFNHNADAQHWELGADYAMFDAQGTGTTSIYQQSFTWDINDAGQLEVTFDANQQVLTYTIYQEFDDSYGVHVSVHADGQYFSDYSLTVKNVDNTSVEALVGEFMMNSFTLTNKDAFDDDGNVIDGSVFGYRLEEEGVATRVWDGAANYEQYGKGWDRWTWKTADNGNIVLDAFASGHPDWIAHAQCQPDNDDNCNNWRRRYWQPLNKVGNRLYVLEWEERNGNAWNFDGSAEDWFIAFPPRVQFYEVFSLDFDHDGIPDDVDTDDDNDGVPDEDDAFPYNVYEWLDTDGDGIGNNADHDDDNDGVNDEEDVFPLDASEWADHDMDGIGNNADTDDDNDGVADTEDLAPFDDSIGAALTLTAAELATDYISIVRGKLDNPTIKVGYRSGTTHHFGEGSNGHVAARTGSSDFTWQIADDELTIDLSASPQVSSGFYAIYALVELGVISEDKYHEYIMQHGDESIHAELSTVAQSWQLLENGDELDKFWSISTQSYHLVEEWQREFFYGATEGVDVEIETEGSELILTEKAALSAIAYTDADITGSWALPIGFEPMNENVEQRVVADLGNFNANKTGTTSIYNKSFTWDVNESGALVVTFDNSGYVQTFTRYEEFENSELVLMESTVGNDSFTAYNLAAKQAEAVDYSPIIGKFMMNSFTLTDPDYFDDYGKVNNEDVFGYQLNDDETATRIWRGDFNLHNHRDGWDTWLFKDDNGEIILDANNDENAGVYVPCNPINNDSCNVWRRRHWQPLALVGERLYVLEWEERNEHPWTFPSMEESWYIAIVPRLQFYEVYDLH